MDMNDKDFLSLAVAIMNDVKASGARVDSLDDMYNVACKYVQVSKEEFEKYCKQADENLKLLSENHELAENELDMVVGGGLMGDIGDWFKDHAVTIGVVAAGILVVTGIGAGVGGGIAAMCAALASNLSVAGCASAGASAIGSIAFGASLMVAPVLIGMNAFEDAF